MAAGKLVDAFVDDQIITEVTGKNSKPNLCISLVPLYVRLVPAFNPQSNGLGAATLAALCQARTVNAFLAS
jgi:hypothetical protein